MVSVIVPVYNQEKYLKKCVDSILNGTYKDIECIIVDDGSKDASPALCDEYKSDPRVTVIHKPNGGLTSARKAGFDASKGEYICFVDSDDYVAPEFVEKLYKALTDSDADVSVCGHFRDDNGVIIEHTYEMPDRVIEGNIIDEYVLPVIGKVYAVGYENYPGYVWGRLYRRECISEKCFISEREVYTEDDIFQMFIAENAQKIVFIKDKLVYYRDNSESLTRRYRKGMFDMLKRRHGIVCDYFKEHKINNDVRLMGSAFYTLYVSITNAYLLEGEKSAVSEIKSIREDRFTENALKTVRFSLLRPRQKMFYILFRFKLYKLVYRMRNLMF
ncbi:Glycosyl transferase family 2 [Lachnospiraceae bacterium]|nr:Glycosyl transferase family 2 [Lachnospiraceae bacterium]